MSRLKIIAAFLSLLMPTILVAGVQKITASPASIFAHAGQGFELNIDYASDNPALTGVGAKLFFDSSKIQLVQIAAVYAAGKLAIDTQSRPDNKNADGDTNTDQVVNAAWFDIGGNWPGQSSVSLFTARFIANADFNGSTSINFRGNPAANSEVVVPFVSVQGDALSEENGSNAVAAGDDVVDSGSPDNQIFADSGQGQSSDGASDSTGGHSSDYKNNDGSFVENDSVSRNVANQAGNVGAADSGVATRIFRPDKNQSSVGSVGGVAVSTVGDRSSDSGDAGANHSGIEDSKPFRGDSENTSQSDSNQSISEKKSLPDNTNRAVLGDSGDNPASLKSSGTGTAMDSGNAGSGEQWILPINIFIFLMIATLTTMVFRSWKQSGE